MFKFSRLLPEKPKEEVQLKLNHSWRLFNIPETRDLAWLLFSPPLVKTFNEAPNLELVDDEQSAIAWLKNLDSDEKRGLPQRSQFKRLGLYFEALIHFILSPKEPLNFINYQLLDSHLQIKSNSTTLGEIDFILQSRSRKKVHLEATVKFYLQKKSAKNELKNSQTQWVGPNARDRLDKKFNKLFFKQLPLSTKQQFVEQFPEYGNITQHGHIFSGILFHHWCDSAATPCNINPACLRGHWLAHSEFAALIKKQLYSFAPMEKLAWLGGQPTELKTPPLATLTPSHNRNKAMCFTRHWPQNTANEIGRLMVVPDHWPKESAP